MSTRLRSGDVLAGRYQIEHLLGQGSSGEVWAARERSTGAHFALKVLAAEAATDDETVERFRREAYFLARTRSPHVARIHDFVCDPTIGMALVMELVEGDVLACRLDERTLSVEEAIELGVDLLTGVEVLHAARVIHRDLKPGNILLRPQQDGRLGAVICDFGLSRLARRREGDSVSSASLTELTRGDVTMGTLRYMAPEQVLNARQATEQSDLYAVGAILYRAVTGVHAFDEHPEARDVARAKVTSEAPPFETGRSDPVARALERVVTRALRRRPAERHGSATEMRVELARALALGGEDETERTSLPELLEAMPPARPYRGWSAAAVCGVVLVFAGGVATGRAWTLEDLRPVAGPRATPSSMQAAPPRIEAPVALGDIAELPASAPPSPPAATLAALQLPRTPHPAAARPATDDDNPYAEDLVEPRR